MISLFFNLCAIFRKQINNFLKHLGKHRFCDNQSLKIVLEISIYYVNRYLRQILFSNMLSKVLRSIFLQFFQSTSNTYLGKNVSKFWQRNLFMWKQCKCNFLKKKVFVYILGILQNSVWKPSSLPIPSSTVRATMCIIRGFLVRLMEPRETTTFPCGYGHLPYTLNPHSKKIDQI